MSYPKRLKDFKAWAKAMEEGATVDRPSYGKTLNGPSRAGKPRKRPRRRRRRSTQARRLRKMGEA